MSILQDVDVGVYELADTLPYRVHAERPMLFTMLGNLEGQHVLDIGCRRGWYTRQFRERGAARVVGADPSGRLIDAARATGGAGVEYVTADLAALGDLGSDFDVVTAAHVLHFASSAENLAAVCRSAWQALRPGGRLVAICSSPFFQRGAYDTATYGIVFDQQGQTLTDGDPITAEIRGDGRSERIEAHYWSIGAYTTALRDAGFGNIAWHLPEVSEDGMRDARLWDAFLRQPFFVGLECSKLSHAIPRQSGKDMPR